MTIGLIVLAPGVTGGLIYLSLQPGDYLVRGKDAIPVAFPYKHDADDD